MTPQAAIETTSRFQEFSDFLPSLQGKEVENQSISTKTRGFHPEIHISVHQDMADLKQVWLELQEEGDCTPFQSYGWLSAWQRHIGTKLGVQPVIVAGWDTNGRAIFIMPLGLESSFLCEKLVWLGGDVSDYHAPLLSEGFSRLITPQQFIGLWKAVRQKLPVHHIVELGRMPTEIGRQRNPFMALGNLRQHAASAHMTRLRPEWESYYAEKRSSGSKKRDKQKRRKLAELGDISFVSPESPEERLSIFDALVAQKSVSLNRMGVANIFQQAGRLEFYRSLLADPETSNLVHISHLSVGGRVAATSCGLSLASRYSYILASYDMDSEEARFGPGMIQLMELMKHATETGHNVFDFTIGDEAYKAHWCETEIPLFDYIEPNTLMGWLETGPRIAFLQVKRFIKQTPLLWQAFTRLRAVCGQVAVPSFLSRG